MTAEEKANKYAEETIPILHSDSDSELRQDFTQKQRKYAKVDFLAGYKEGQSNPKIKQLKWEEYENLLGRKSYFAKTPFTPYEVADGGKHYTMYGPDKRLRFASADKAKAAAQADFEKRIIECLIL